MTLLIVLIYLGVVLAIGLGSNRLLRTSGDDFFTASRSVGPFVLLMTLFGTHMTSFALLGAAAESYRVGIGVFGLMASSAALVVPVVTLVVGVRVWRLGRQHNLLTQVQWIRERFQSETLAIALFFVLVLLLIPYLLIGVMGGGITLNEITGGSVPEWVGGLLISVVVVLYVTAGGLRGTSWVNTFQTVLFMTLGAVTFFIILGRMGGLEAAMVQLARESPASLVRGDKMPPLKFLSYMLIPLSAGTFPHIFQHWLSARSAATFRLPVAAYPLCLTVVWLPSVLLGVFGRLNFPDLAGPATNSVLVAMIATHASGVLAGLLGAGVFAAIMSSLDSQTLALSSLFTHDIAGRYRWFGRRLSEQGRVRAARVFVVTIVVLTFVLSLVAKRSIFGLATWSFSGFAALFPVFLGAVFWRRATAFGSLAAVFVTAALWLYFFVDAGGRADYSVLTPGLMPVVVLCAASSAALVVGSWLTQPPPAEVVRRFVGS